jgi:uncharacterized membrane protein YjjB (DUF3815 family)
VDKYIVFVLVFLVAGMVIAIISIPPRYELFYIMLGGAIAAVVYDTIQNRKKRKGGVDSRKQKKITKK